MPLATYQQLLSEYSGKYSLLNKRLGWLSFIRLLLFIGIIVFGYYYLVYDDWYWLALILTCLGSFLYCLRLYDVIKAKADFIKALMEVNSREIHFLKEDVLPYADGKEYTDPHHSYSYDLDLFGEGSLYKHLNRTTTVFGKEALAGSLLHPDTAAIAKRQEAIKELSGKVDFRQHIQASGSIHVTEPADLDKLKAWIRSASAFKSPLSYYILLVFPFATLAVLCSYFLSGSDRLLSIFFGLFVLNLFVTFSFIRFMMKQMSVSTAITKVLRQFAEQLKQIEKQSFHSPLLQQLQSRLKQDSTNASQFIRKLASLFKYLDFILNLVVSTFLNGLFLFHVHILYALDQWKKKHANEVMNWLQVIGEFEALGCFANLAFNNPAYGYPELSAHEDLTATEMGHPLIRSERRICNTISFQQEKFVVLTGSNMSGKSTFLRTLGMNLVLARSGSVVCAKAFSLFPYDLHVSMRITDSLQDSESFFYAELKRLKSIMEHLRSDGKIFIILDEILRGTNSNDKHNGTAGLIRKLAAWQCSGIIATHDLTIASMSAEYPDYMSNKCFESVIINDELLFDYKLKDGVCSKLNASFLMKQMGIID
ncbi:MAG: DNA mismatch repair protein MutS [Chitinophagaceae bacterium]|nr:DNA mismatch repair protein MutS [Chitinophagaceae bacterium]